MRNNKTVKALRKDLKNDIIESAAKIAMKKANAASETRKLQEKVNDPTRKQKEIHNFTRHFLRYKLEMSEQEYLNAVSQKLSAIVGDNLNLIHEKLNEIPPQNLAYTLSVLFDKLMILNGRPTNITASANVKLGASDMTPDKVRSILKGAKKATQNLPKEASNEKVIEVSDEKSG
jgi:hypothetical protein